MVGLGEAGWGAQQTKPDKTKMEAQQLGTIQLVDMCIAHFLGHIGDENLRNHIVDMRNSGKLDALLVPNYHATMRTKFVQCAPAHFTQSHEELRRA